MHPGVYVIHNDAPRSLRQIEEIIERIDVSALRDAGMSIGLGGQRPAAGGSISLHAPER
jgi:hypothetical protein